MKIEVQQVGQLMTNCYIVWDEHTKNAAVIDPGDDGAYLADCLKKNGLTLQYILLTHGHFDHVGGVAPLYAELGCRVYLCQKDTQLPPGPSVRPQLPLKSVSPEKMTSSLSKQTEPGVWPGVSMTWNRSVPKVKSSPSA